jgi:hypothetical protein
VTLQMSNWPTVLRDDGTPAEPFRPALDRPQPSIWACPYCDRGNEGGFVGRLVWVQRGHQPAPTI